MAIISANNDPKHYGNTQFRYGTVYIIITFVALVFLNLYCSNACQRSFYQSKRSEVTARAKLLGHTLEDLEVLSHDQADQIISSSSANDELFIVLFDKNGQRIFQNGDTGYDTPLLDDLQKAFNGNDLFLWTYRDRVTRSEIAIPLYHKGMITGTLYVMETDPVQGALIVSLQRMILSITVVLELVVILFTYIFATAFSRRTRSIMGSMEILKQGDYSHRVALGGSDELTYLADEINELTERLETSERKRRQFISDASHELKTPLASIKLLTDSILQNADLDPMIVREFVSDIGDESERLIRLSEKMLSLTRGEAQENEPQEVILMEPTIARVVTMLSIHAEANNVTIFTDLRDDVPILVREDDLYQIAFNLAENGIKYNVPGGVLQLRLKHEGGYGILIVEDSGTGIPEDAINHIYERFYRVDKARSRATGGIGLGLSIVRTMVDRNKGSIHVESTFGQGTRFTVRFPAYRPEGEQA
ncbi:MAG: HAMP domain-containing histidine kinase [Oscillospiraceae bacterium]|nr:HAMP domain-containing histidine kinase [Oscillospiraceae bacterium]